MESNRILKDHTYGLQLFCCKHCLKEFRNKHAFAQHTEHDCDGQKKTHLCKVCNKIFPTKTKLHCHSVVNHKKKAKFYCKICKTYWINKDMFLAHISTHAGERKLYKCVECDRKYKTIGKFRVHRALHYEKKLQGECQLCLKKFSNAKLLHLHKCEKAGTSLVQDGPIPVELFKPCIGKHAYEGYNKERVNSLIDLNQLKSKSNQFRLILPKPVNAPTPNTFECNVCRNMFPAMSVVGKDGLKSTNPEYICIPCEELLNQKSKHKHSKPTNKSIELNMLNSIKNEVSLVLPKSEPLSVPTSNTFECKFCGNFFPFKSVIGKDSLSCINEYICRTCNENQCSPELLNKKPTDTCEKCGKTFSSVKVCKIHMLRSKSCGSLTLSCEKCKQVFYTNNALMQHLADPVNCKAYTKGKLLKCEYCTRTFQKSAALKIHIATHIKDRNRVCVKCGMKFRNIEQLTQHYNINEECREGEEYQKYLSVKESEYKCDECGRCDFTNADTFHSHRLSHSKDVVCGKCGAKFQLMEVLRQHEKETCMADHACEFCGKKGFSNRRQLTAHLKEHVPSLGVIKKIINDTKSLKCENCDMTFARRPALNTHQKHKCAGGLMCHYCAQSGFRDKREYRRHMTDHDPNYSVETENFNISSSFSLSQDLYCKLCFTSFGTPNAKEVHMQRLHGTEEKPRPAVNNSHSTGEKFLCRVCGAVLSSPKALTDHEKKVHTAKVACDVCGKAVRPDHIVMHKRKHTGEMPYDCKTCGKRFKFRTNMLYHIKVQKCSIQD